MTQPDHSERLSFIELDAARAAALEPVLPALGAAMPAALDALYADIASREETAAKFPDSQTTLRARTAMERHWAGVLAAPRDPARAEQARRIGLAHARLGLEPRWYMGAYARVMATLSAAAIRSAIGRFAAPGRVRRAEAAVDGLVRTLVLDMELAITAYLEERDERARGERIETAKAIEDSVGEVVSSLNEAAKTLEEQARAATEAVSRTRERASGAAAGSEEAAASVRSVAAASSQLGAASREISGQVNGQTEGLTRAVEEA
ncbi:MAG: protoglobin domain-containing protein, partial [Oceanicaulis sp.]